MPVFDFVFEADGKKFSCSYEISSGRQLTVEVYTPWGNKSAKKEDSPASAIAQLVAGELYREANAKI